MDEIQRELENLKNEIGKLALQKYELQEKLKFAEEKLEYRQQVIEKCLRLLEEFN